jgi:hypothetical protein
VYFFTFSFFYIIVFLGAGPELFHHLLATLNMPFKDLLTAAIYGTSPMALTAPWSHPGVTTTTLESPAPGVTGAPVSLVTSVTSSTHLSAGYSLLVPSHEAMQAITWHLSWLAAGIVILLAAAGHKGIKSTAAAGPGAPAGGGGGAAAAAACRTKATTAGVSAGAAAGGGGDAGAAASS